MEDDRFDALARRAAGNANRRGFMKLLAGGIVASLVGVVALDDGADGVTAARQVRPTRTPRPTNTPRPTLTPRPTNTPRPTSTPRATNTPRPTLTPRPTNTPRPTSTPACGALTSCGGTCVDTQVDPNNCGACGIVCAQGRQTCEAGRCRGGSAGPGLCTDPTFTCNQPCQLAINSETGVGCECYTRCRGACYPCDAATNDCVAVPTITCGPCQDATDDFETGTCACVDRCDACSSCDSATGECSSVCDPLAQACDQATGTCV